MEKKEGGKEQNKASMTGLPREVLMNILSRLSVKLLFQLKCVSKQWLCLISDPYLKKLHRNQSERKPRLLLSRQASDGHYVSHTVHLATIDASNGRVQNEFTRDITGHYHELISGGDLVCFVQPGHVGQLWLCNPSTNEFVSLPLLSHDFQYGRVGLGYLPSSNEYKVVVSFESNLDHGIPGKSAFDILTIENGVPNPGPWRGLKTPPPVANTRADPVCMNEALYWLMAERNVYDQHDMKVLSLDLETEVFRTICCPQGVPEPDDCIFYKDILVELKGFLCLVNHVKRISTLDLWVLKDQENHIWDKEYSIDLDNMGSCFRVSGYFPSSDHSGQILIWSEEESLLFYNHQNNRLTRAENLNIQGQKLHRLYFDSFFSLGSR